MGKDESRSGPSLDLLWRLAVVPAVLLAGVVLVSLLLVLRSGLGLNGDGLGALWVLLASLIATVGAFVGALLTASSAETAREMERDREQRTQEMERDREQRLSWESDRQDHQRRVDATIQGIRIFEVAPKSHIISAGAFAMVLGLGEPEVALRMLGPALAQEDVDAGTAAGVIDKVLRAKNLDDSVKDYAAQLLLRHAKQFTSQEVPGAFVWPSCLLQKWPTDLDANTGALVVMAMTDLLTSRRLDWWTQEGGGWEWVTQTLLLAVNAEPNDKDPSEGIKKYAAAALELLHSQNTDGWDDGVQAAVNACGRAELGESRKQRLQSWMEGMDVHQPSPAETALQVSDALGSGGIASTPTLHADDQSNTPTLEPSPRNDHKPE